MPCRSQEEEEDLERVKVDRCLMGSSLGCRAARARGTGCGEARSKADRCSWPPGRRALLPTVHSHGSCSGPLWLSLTSPSANPGSQSCHSWWGPRHGPWSDTGACWSPVLPLTEPQLSARPGWALLPTRARCSPCPPHRLCRGVWLRVALASQRRRQPLVQRPGCAPQSTACTCVSSLCGLGQMWTRTPCGASRPNTAVLEAKKPLIDALPEGPRVKCVFIYSCIYVAFVLFTFIHLFIFLLIYRSFHHLCIYLLMNLFNHLYIHWSIYVFIDIPLYLWIYVFICSFIYVFICLCIELFTIN
jgi:hypothetical protein